MIARGLAVGLMTLTAVSAIDAQAKPAPKPAPKPTTTTAEPARPASTTRPRAGTTPAAPAPAPAPSPVEESAARAPQSAPNMSTVVGVHSGLHFATFGGPDIEDVKRLLTTTGGLYIVKPLSSSISLRPEVLFSPKGAKASLEGLDASIRLTYVDVPVLLQFEPRGNPGVRPLLHAGGAFAYNFGCSVKAQVEGGESQTIKCNEGDFFEPASTELSAIVGGGLSFPINGRRLTVGGRYQHGFTEIAKDGGIRSLIC
jgi:hypothetical protein